MRPLRFAPLLIWLTLLLTARAASADPLITLTRCEPTTWNGQTAELVTFSVHPGTYPVIIITVKPVVQSAVSDSCPILFAAQKQDWDAVLWADGSVTWSYNYMPSYVGFWDGFQMILAGTHCCDQIQLSAIGHPDVVGTETNCFACSAPVPSRVTTWGTLKDVYR